MGTYRKIISDNLLGISVLVTFSIFTTACPSTVQPVDTSQQILIEIAEAASEVDQSIAERLPSAQDRSRAEVMTEINRLREERHACIQAGTHPNECVEAPDEEQAIELYEAKLTSWNNLITSLSALHGTLRAWEQINDEWRASGDRPMSWVNMVCDPLGTLTGTILDLLVDVGVPISERWRTVAGYADAVCSLGVSAVEYATEGDE